MEYWRWQMVKETGWSLEYVDGLSLGDWHEYWQVADGQHKADKSRRQAASFAAQHKRR